ncbi:flavin reductase family protein [Saxibacter everestensis]|uniref:Flavin reductase family protein n=1 Tax=Saxibacter everestensis TaxID=2909229 RepID=A0ABY8QYH5_9MICO|nr:flavin reductase family protein [Brevibacteriaceae bacterium ZFBP1038]
MAVQLQKQTADMQLALRQALSLFPTGVVAACALIDGSPVGMSMNSFTSVSLDPPLVSICVARTSTTWPILKTSDRLGLSVLGAQQSALCRRLASRSQERFESGEWQARESGAVLLNDATLWLECEQYASVDGGDHEVILLEVVDSELFPDVKPLIFHQSKFHELQAH